MPGGVIAYEAHGNGWMYQEWKVALEWGVDLDRWYTLSRQARLGMMATSLAKSHEAAAESYEFSLRIKPPT